MENGRLHESRLDFRRDSVASEVERESLLRNGIERDTIELGGKPLSARICGTCGVPVPAENVFCSECGAYQGHPATTPFPLPGGEAGGLRPCPYCAMPMSNILMACTNCFRPLQPTGVLSGPELRPASNGLVIFLMVAAAVLVIGWFLLPVILGLIAAALGHHNSGMGHFTFG